MQLFNHVMVLLFGEIPEIWKHDHITVYSVDGCMAETLTPIYSGIVTKKKRVKCYGTSEKDGKIPAIEIMVTKVHKGSSRVGETKTELVCHLRKLKDSSKAILI